MKHCLLAAAAALVVVPLQAAERTPEQLLPPTTQVYARWDGIAAHKEAYAQSARGQMFAGESGKALDALWGKLMRQAKLSLVGEPLLQGKAADELMKSHADVKALLGLPKLLAQTGIVAGFEIRPPVYDLKTLYDLARGDPAARERLSVPQFQITLIAPGAAEKPELAAAVRLMKSGSASIKEQAILDRKVTSIEAPNETALVASWAEGPHFVLAVSNQPIEKIVAKVKDAGAGITANPLVAKLAGFKDFRVVTRGFLDAGAAARSFEKLARDYAPEVWGVLEELGLTGIKSACFWDGFEGDESRGVVEIDFAGQRRGLTRMFAPDPASRERPRPLRIEDLPPMPADLTRFAAIRWDLGSAYELFHLFDINGLFNDGADKDVPVAERLRKHKEAFLAQADDAVGFKLAELFAALDDKVITYQAPSDGILNVGQVLMIGVKDEKALRRSMDMLAKKIEGLSRNVLTVRKRDCLGVEVREFTVKAKSPVTPACAICDGWLVIGMQPQPVRGFIHRAKGKLPVWKPDARTAATLAQMPRDCCVLQVADPRPTLNWLLNGAPIVAGLLTGRDDKEPFIEPGIFPHAGEATKPLFANVMWCRDDGKTMRWESRDSLWLPLEFMGMELIGVYFGVAGGLAF